MHILKMGVVRLTSWYISAMGYDHAVVQQEYANRMVDRLYQMAGNRLKLLTPELYHEVEEMYQNLFGVIIASPTFYESVKNTYRFIEMNEARYIEILKSTEETHDEQDL